VEEQRVLAEDARERVKELEEELEAVVGDLREREREREDLRRELAKGEARLREEEEKVVALNKLQQTLSAEMHRHSQDREKERTAAAEREREAISCVEALRKELRRAGEEGSMLERERQREEGSRLEQGSMLEELRGELVRLQEEVQEGRSEREKLRR